MLEHNDMKWLTVNELTEYEFCPADEEIINFLKDRYSGSVAVSEEVLALRSEAKCTALCGICIKNEEGVILKILSVSGCPYEDYEGQILNLCIEMGEGEELSLNDIISIEMMDDTFLEREVLLINPNLAGDYYTISEKTRKKVESGEYGVSKDPTSRIKGPCIADIAVTDVPYHEVKTDRNIANKKFVEEVEKKTCLSPFRELHFGDKSIHDYVQEGYSVPEKVIVYLRTTKPFMMCPGIYEHPFKPGKKLLGPYYYTDGIHFWDRDLWKYVLKYHVTLPDEFVEYVMSGAGDAFLESFYKNPDSWTNVIRNMKKQEKGICLLPDDAGEIDLSDF